MTSEELRNLLKSQRGLQTKVAEASGIAYTTLNSFVTGKSQQLRHDGMMKVLNALEQMGIRPSIVGETPREFEPPPAATLHVNISSDDLQDAAKYGLDPKEIARRAVEEKVKEARLKAWVSENKSAFDAHARDVEENGLWSDGLRQF